MTLTGNPLLADSPSEVALPNAPLDRVLIQLRFPPIISIKTDSYVAPFQEAIRKDYPVLRPEEVRNFLLDPERVQERTAKIWRFYDLEEDWRVSLGSEFLALETTNYKSRHNLVERFGKIVQALEAHFDPQVIDRLGVRYIDRIRGDAYTQLSTLVRKEVSGILSTELSEFSQQSISESIFEVPDEPWTMIARWGKLPPNFTIDPNVLQPIDSESWILDLDTFHQESRPLDVENLMGQVQQFSERIYTFFRWAVTEEFLRLYGGEV